MTLQMKLKSILNNKNILYFFMGTVSGLLLFYLYSKLPVKIEISQDVSLPYSVWLSLPFKQKPYVEFPVYWDDRYFPKNKSFLIKQLVCDEMHYLKVTRDKKYYCDGEYLGKAVNTDKNGNPVENFKYDGIIPKGKCFVIGTHIRSYDSRYFGFIDKNKIIRYLYPLF